MKKGLFYAILASVLWAIVNPFIKQGLSYDFSPMNFAGIRFTTVGIILFAYTWHKGMWKEIRQHSKLFLNLILINMFMGYTAFYFGVDFVSGAISSIIMGMTPLINVLLAHLLASNDRLNVHKIISLIVSLIGLLLIVGMGSNGAPLDWKGITGIVLLLLSIIFQGYSAISVSEDKGKVNPIFLNAVQMFFGIEEDRIDPALVLRNRNRGVALKDDARQQQHDAPDAAPVERRTVAARADDQQQSRQTDQQAHDLVAVQPVVAGQQMRQQHVDQRREAHDDRADGSADEVHAEIKRRVAQEHVDQNEIAEQPLVTHDLAPHAAVPRVGEEDDADGREAQPGEIHRRKIVAESLFDERIDEGPQHRGQYSIENTFFHNT